MIEKIIAERLIIKVV